MSGGYPFPSPPPASPEPAGPPDVARPIPAPPQPRAPIKPSPWLTAGLCVVAGIVIGSVMWALVSRESALTSGQGSAQLRTATATFGEFTKSLRIGGTVETLQHVAIKAPKLRGPGNADRAPFTLAALAEAGIVVPAGSVVAEFELPWLLNWISSRQLVQAVAESNARKRESEIAILKETERQSRLAAKARALKAELDFSTAEVRSKIEGEILRNVADEARAIWQQKERERQFKEIVWSADLRKAQLTARAAELQVERHLHDLERLQMETPIAGMVVLRPTYKAGTFGLFAQTRTGDRLSPGTLFMRIVDVSEMIVDASVNQVDAQKIRMGDRAFIELDAYPGERFEGRVVDFGAVAGSGEYGRGGAHSFVKQIPARIRIETKDERILPGLSASVDVVYSSPQSGVLVPMEAIQSEPGAEGGSFVHVAGDGAYHKRPVRVQDFNDTEALVSAGLASGEEVLLTALPEHRDNT